MFVLTKTPYNLTSKPIIRAFSTSIKLSKSSKFSKSSTSKMASRPNIHLYTAQTPNGTKISITLEELSLPYTTTAISFAKNEQKSPPFVAINPNGRIPALTDTFSDGKTINLFESGSIQQYLVEQYDTEHKISYPRGSREAYEVNNWLFFLNAGVGPMQGQSNHFTRYAPEKIEYGINRYQNETRRLYGVLNTHLEKSTSGYLVGDRCTIADIAHYGWIVSPLSHKSESESKGLMVNRPQRTGRAWTSNRSPR